MRNSIKDKIPSSKHTIFSSAVILAIAVIAWPQQSMAQRFNHGGGGGGGSHPAPAPAPRQAAPAPRQVATPRTETPRQVATPRTEAPRPEVHEDAPRTINGGSQNFGNHDYNRTVNVHENVNVQRTVTVRDHVNVYHTGAYRGVHPYYYHPYRPSYWGPHWHPLGFFLGALAADAIFFNFNNQRYYYDDGCYYLPSNGGYSVVPAPIGATVGSLPDGFETTMVGNDTFYYFGGAFYVAIDGGYQVVAAPPGAVITQLPVGAVEQQINGQDLLVYNNVYYSPISQDGQDAYEVVTP
jgi:hypothetical protein